MAIDFKEDVVGSGRSIVGALIASAGTALVAWLRNQGIEVSPEEALAITGFLVTAWGLTMKVIKAKRGH